MIRTLARAGAWLLAAAIVLLSVVPPWLRPVLGPHDGEHAVAFIAFGACVGVGYAGRYAVAAVSTMVFCTLVELAQLWAPGRHARVEDLVVDVLAALAGIGLAAVLSRLAGAGSGSTTAS